MDNPNLIFNVSTLEEYLNISEFRRQRRVAWWPTPWYIEPFAMSWDPRSKESEWSKIHNYFKRRYPVQFFFREVLTREFTLLFDYKLKDIKWKLKHRISHPRKELRKAIFPPIYQDLDTVIVNFHLQVIIDYVEREKCFEMFDWTGELYSKLKPELQEVYDYATRGRALLEKDIEAAYDQLHKQEENTPYDQIRARSYEERYGTINAKEAWLKECDTKVCKWVIENREYLWT